MLHEETTDLKLFEMLQVKRGGGVVAGVYGSQAGTRRFSYEKWKKETVISNCTICHLRFSPPPPPPLQHVVHNLFPVSIWTIHSFPVNHLFELHISERHKLQRISQIRTTINLKERLFTSPRGFINTNAIQVYLKSFQYFVLGWPPSLSICVVQERATRSLSNENVA